MTTKVDQAIDKAADRLRQFADRAASEGGPAGMLAQPLAEDAAFLRKLKPTLIIARARGQAPTNQPAGSAAPVTPTPRPKQKKRGGGPSPFLIVGGALVAGIVLAKLIDWRGHAHPRN
jgi:hypothetical protein